MVTAMKGALGALCCMLLAAQASAQIRVSPTGVSTNAMNATTVFLTFGGLRQQVPVEGLWCGEIVAARPPERGMSCDPSTIYGRLPARSFLGAVNRDGSFTDIMSIPASVARRAYQSALKSQSGTFFYVRRFARTDGGPDEFVVVTCRLTGGGANVPLSLTDVTIAFETESPVQFVEPGQVPPSLAATLSYNGSGTLRGRWEVVMPGEEMPSANDLRTESSIPADQRGLQRRYALLDRFNIVLPPNGRVRVPGPDPSRLPRNVDGTYFVLLRIESSDDKAGDSDLNAAGGAGGVLHNGAVAGFSLPMLRYVVGAAANDVARNDVARNDVARDERRVGLSLVTPRPNAVVPRDSSLTARWTAVWGATYYRVEFKTLAGAPLLTAITRGDGLTYGVPPRVAERAAGAAVQWRVTALDARGNGMRRSEWLRFEFSEPRNK